MNWSNLYRGQCVGCVKLRKVGFSLVMPCFLILGLLKFYPKEHVDYQDTQGNDFNQSKLQLFTYPLTLLSLIFFFSMKLSDLALATKEHFASGPTLSYFR